MYGWERKSGNMRAHFGEDAMTEDDILRALHRTKGALLAPATGSRSDSNANNDRRGDGNAQRLLSLTPAPPDVAVVPERMCVWTEAKAAGVEAYQRGDFLLAAARFASAAALRIAPPQASAAFVVESAPEGGCSHGVDADGYGETSGIAKKVDAATMDSDGGGVGDGDDGDDGDGDNEKTATTLAADLAADLAALHSNISSALLVGARSM
jgi:hypothetical protein